MWTLPIVECSHLVALGSYGNHYLRRTEIHSSCGLCEKEGGREGGGRGREGGREGRREGERKGGREGGKEGVIYNS